MSSLHECPQQGVDATMAGHGALSHSASVLVLFGGCYWIVKLGHNYQGAEAAVSYWNLQAKQTQFGFNAVS